VKRAADVVMRRQTSGNVAPRRAIWTVGLGSVYLLFSSSPCCGTDVTDGALVGRDGRNAAGRAGEVDESESACVNGWVCGRGWREESGARAG
jgi:hypothetical protein